MFFHFELRGFSDRSVWEEGTFFYISREEGTKCICGTMGGKKKVNGPDGNMMIWLGFVCAGQSKTSCHAKQQRSALSLPSQPNAVRGDSPLTVSKQSTTFYSPVLYVAQCCPRCLLAWATVLQRTIWGGGESSFIRQSLVTLQIDLPLKQDENLHTVCVVKTQWTRSGDPQSRCLQRQLPCCGSRCNRIWGWAAGGRAVFFLQVNQDSEVGGRGLGWLEVLLAGQGVALVPFIAWKQQEQVGGCRGTIRDHPTGSHAECFPTETSHLLMVSSGGHNGVHQWHTCTYQVNHPSSTQVILSPFWTPGLLSGQTTLLPNHWHD